LWNNQSSLSAFRGIALRSEQYDQDEEDAIEELRMTVHLTSARSA
jgi:hypothetical protein